MKSSSSSLSRLRRPLAAVVFDMDGLIFNTETLYQVAISCAGAEGGYDLSGAGRLMIGRPLDQSRHLLVELYGGEFPVEPFITAMFRHFDRLAATQLALKPGVIELLDTLDDLRLPRAIATSSAHTRVQNHLKTHGLLGRFDAIVGHGDYMASKPAPDPYLVAAKQLEAEPELCLALEDSHNGIRSANAAGMMTAMVPDLLEPTDEIRALCTVIAQDLHEVRRILLDALVS